MGLAGELGTAAVAGGTVVSWAFASAEAVSVSAPTGTRLFSGLVSLAFVPPAAAAVAAAVSAAVAEGEEAAASASVAEVEEGALPVRMSPPGKTSLSVDDTLVVGSGGSSAGDSVPLRFLRRAWYSVSLLA